MKASQWVLPVPCLSLRRTTSVIETPHFRLQLANPAETRALKPHRDDPFEMFLLDVHSITAN